ncbi:MAG: ABC transporter ATP-binding protein [Comamonadaceae bacterium PBBC2]|nr:MAG: ABC transporter ATP-binding protein [Comamonadaceae bacterium PBBC2]
MILVENLSKQFVTPKRFRVPAVTVQAVADMSFTADNGCITGLLGANGAGKTTSLRIVAGLLTADTGRVMIDDIDVRQNPRAALARIGCLSDSRGLYPRLTARENVIYYGRLQGLSQLAAVKRTDELGELLDMTELLDRRTEGFSQGERMKTALARALIHDPANLLLDEPTNGLDVVATRRLRDALRHLASPQGGNKCIVFSTHIMQEVERLCGDVSVVAAGRDVARGSVRALCEQTGCPDFEDAFVALAFAPGVGVAA